MGPGDLLAQAVHGVVSVAKPVVQTGSSLLEHIDHTVQRATGHAEDSVDEMWTEDEPEEENPETDVSPTELLRELLDRSMYDTPDQSRNALYVALLKQLVPDEARILAALSDGTAYPVVHIGEPGAGDTKLVLRNASTVGRAAGVAQPQHTPVYVTRLLNLGLAQLGAEATECRDDYEMLLTDPAVHSAISANSRSLRPARVIRRTISLSDLGAELWEAAKC